MTYNNIYDRNSIHFNGECILLAIKKIEDINLDIDCKDFKLPDDNSCSNCDYYLVFNTESNCSLAVFDIRKSLDSIKQMSIYYSKQMFENVENRWNVLDDTMEALNIVVTIFKFLLEHDYDVKTTKIYSANNYEYAVFSIMAKNLLTQGYSVRLYSKWIELTKEV